MSYTPSNPPSYETLEDSRRWVYEEFQRISLDFAEIELSGSGGGGTGPIGPQGPPGPTGPQGPTGATGAGVAPGGTAGQVLTKIDATNFNTQWTTPSSGGGGITVEDSQDATAALIQNGTGISWTYNDTANTLTPTVTLAPFTTTNLAEGTNLYFTTGRASSAAPVQSVAGKTGVVTLVKGDVGLGNVDNTSDAAKPVSTATQTALNLKADIASPTFTGDPKAPTPAPGDNDTSIATTAFVTAAVATGTSSGAVAFIGDSPPASPVHGQLWWKSDNGYMHIWYNDGTSSQWVVISPVVFETIGVAAPVTYASFDGVATNVTLSNNNLTATHSTSTSGSGARSLALKTTGKYYYEVVGNSAPGAGDAVALGSAAATYVQLTGNTAGQYVVVYQSTGVIFVSTTNSGKNIASLLAGMVAGIAVDLDARLLWVRSNNGNWNGDPAANPATGVGGITVTAAISFAPMVGYGATAAGHAMTANFGASAFSGAVPAGFTPGWPA